MSRNQAIARDGLSQGTMYAASNAFRLRSLGAKISGRRVLKSLDLDITSGRTTVVLGPGGSGKSTLLRILADSVDRGDELRLPSEEGTGECELPSPIQRRGECACSEELVRFMGQRPVLQPRRVIEELVTAWRLPRDLKGMEAARCLAAGTWAEVSGGWDRLRPLLIKNYGDLPRGEQRLLDLTLMAAGNPHCLLLDEPTAEQSLDDEELAMRLLQSLGHRCSVVMVTHNLRVARLLAHDLVLLIGGEIVESGPARRLFASPRRPRTEYFLRMGC